LYYGKFGSLGIAAKHAGIKSRKTIYNWIDSEPAFAELYQELKANRTDEIKTKLYQAAMGELDLTGPQVTSAIFLLKAFDPKQFAEKHQFGGIPDQPIEVEVNAKGKLLGLLDRIAARTGKAGSGSESDE